MSKYPEPVVSAVIFNPDGKILLCKSHKWNNQYVIPGGHIEWGEKMEEALIREVFEETGLSIHDIRLVSIKECINSDTFHQKKHFIFFDYICKTDSDKVCLNEESEEFIWAGLDEADQYELGGFVKELLIKLRGPHEEQGGTMIFYNY